MTETNIWSSLPVVPQLPLPQRIWAWWLRRGPRRDSGGTVGGNWAFAATQWLTRFTVASEDAFCTLCSPSRPQLIIDLLDFEGFQHTLPVWFFGDAQSRLIKGLLGAETVYLDVGANHGVYALTAAAAGARVIALEPQPRPAEALRRSAACNNFGRLLVMQLAAGSTSGTVPIFNSRRGSSAASLVTARHPGQRTGSPVDVRTVDHLCAELQLSRVDLLKVDVEGFETEVIQGAERTLREMRPIVLFESGAGAPITPFDLLRAAGYRHFFDEDSAITGRLAAPRVEATLTNVVAVPDGALTRMHEVIARAASDVSATGPRS